MNPEQRSRGARRSTGEGQSFPWVPAAIASACAVIWLIALSGQGAQPIWGTNLGRWMVLRTDEFGARALLTHHLFHENWLHLLVNSACVVFAGRALQRRWGASGFSLFYVVSALLVGLISYLVGLCAVYNVSPAPPGAQPFTVSYGASGAALACLAAYTLVGEDRPVFGGLTERYLIWTGMVLGAAGLLALDAASRAAHHQLPALLTPQISGIACGAGLRYLVPYWSRAGAAWQARRLAGQENMESQIKERVDRLLEKISRDGMESLSREEHTFLRAASKHFRNPE